MSNMIVKFMKLDERAVIPKYHTEGSSGFDLYTIEQTVIPPRGTKLISTGLCADIPKGYEIQIRPRSGNSLKTAIRIGNSPATIDSDYTGNLGVIVDNFSDNPLIIDAGFRIAQGVVCPIIKANIVEVAEIMKDSERGANGFGSTGVK